MPTTSCNLMTPTFVANLCCTTSIWETQSECSGYGVASWKHNCHRSSKYIFTTSICNGEARANSTTCRIDPLRHFDQETARGRLAMLGAASTCGTVFVDVHRVAMLLLLRTPSHSPFPIPFTAVWRQRTSPCLVGDWFCVGCV